MPSPRVSSCHSVNRVSKGGRVRLGATYTATRSTASPIPCLYPSSVPSSFPMCSRLAAHRAFFSSRGMPCRPSTVIQPSSSPMMPHPRSSNAGVKRASWGGKASASSRTPSRTSFSDCSRLAMSWISDRASWTSRTKVSKPRSVREMALLVAKQAVLIALPHDISQVFHFCFSSRLIVHSHPMDVVHCSGARVHYFHHPVEQEGCLGRETGGGGGNAVDAVGGRDRDRYAATPSSRQPRTCARASHIVPGFATGRIGEMQELGEMEPGVSARTDRFPTQELVMTTAFGHPFAPPPLLGQPRQPPLAGFSLAASARMNILLLLPLHGLPIVAGKEGGREALLWEKSCGRRGSGLAEKETSSETYATARSLATPLRVSLTSARSLQLCKELSWRQFVPHLASAPPMPFSHASRASGRRNTRQPAWTIRFDTGAPISHSMLHETWD